MVAAGCLSRDPRERCEFGPWAGRGSQGATVLSPAFVVSSVKEADGVSSGLLQRSLVT